MARRSAVIRLGTIRDDRVEDAAPPTIVHFLATFAAPAQPGDDDLLAQISQGDHAAFALLMTQRMRALVRHARQVLRDRHEAEDIAQEAMLRVWIAAGSWQRDAGTFSTWLYRVVHNLCMDHLRDARRALPVPLEAAAETPDPAPDPLTRAMTIEIGRIVSDAIAALPERQGSAIWLCYVQGIGNIAAAERLGISVPALESLLSRGRRQLKELVGRLQDVDGPIVAAAVAIDRARRSRGSRP